MKILIAVGVRRAREAGAAGVAFNHAEELQKLGHQVETWFLDDLQRARDGLRDSNNWNLRLLFLVVFAETRDASMS